VPAAEPDRTEPDEDANPGGRADSPQKAPLDEPAIARIVEESLASWKPPAVYFSGAAVTIGGALGMLVQLLLGTAPRPWSSVLVAIGIGVIILQLLWTRFQIGRGKRATGFAGFTALAFAIVCALILGFVLHPVLNRVYDRYFSHCADPVELTVLVPADGAAWFQESIAEFNRRNIDGHRCRKANVTAFSASWPDVERAMAQGWEPAAADDEEPFEPLRDVGPRPHFWIAESQAQIDLAYGLLDDSAVNYQVFAPEDTAPIGRTPLVLAVPDSVLERGFNDRSQTADSPLHELITELGDAYDTPVLRSDPAVSTTGLLFLRALYGPDAEPGGVGARMENRLADAAAETGIALSPSDTAVLCQLAKQGANPAAAVLTTEAALARYNTGGSLGDECALTESPRSGLAPIYGTELGSLDYQAVELGWSDDPWAARRAHVAEDLRAWLAGEDDRWNPTDMGVRGVRYDGGVIAGDVAFDNDFPVEPDPISAGEFRVLEEVYGRNRVPTDVLLAIDRSATMDESAGGGASRFDLAVDGAVAALDYLGAEDRLGLWTFPADGSASHTEVLGIGPDPGDDVAARLDTTEVSHGVDLHQTVVDGVAALEAAREGERFSAMVVLTDGADADTTETTAAAVHDQLADSRVALYLIAVGDASCRSATFSALAEDPRVTCFEAEQQQITTTFDGLFNQLWSGDA
jgi:hypothetical protein